MRYLPREAARDRGGPPWGEAPIHRLGLLGFRPLRIVS